MKRPYRWLPATSHLWPAVVLAAFGFYASLVPLPPNDFWWHLKIGESIYTQRALPEANLFAWTLPAMTPYVYGAWLSELLLYLLYRWGGVALTLFVRTNLLLATFALVAWEARRRGDSWRIAALTLACAALMSFDNLIVRPQIWSWLPFAVFLVLLSRYVERQLRGHWLLLMPLVMLFWVNVHGAFILGLVLSGIFLVGESLRCVFKMQGVRSRRELLWLGAMVGLTVLATLINPRGLGVVDYVFSLLTDLPSQRLIVEWQSPTPQGVAGMSFYLTILVLLLLLVYSRYRPTLTEVLLVLAFLWLAWNGQRYVIWFGLVVAPLLARLIRDLPWRMLKFTAQRNVLNLVLLLLLIVPLILAQPWFVELLPLPKAYWDQVWRGRQEGPLLRVETPLDAVAYLKVHPGGRLFNEMGYGSYLIWALPEQGVFIDPRVELYPYEQWLDYVRITRGTRYNELLDSYGVQRLLVDTAQQGELIAALEHDPLWEQEYADAHTQLWRRP